MAKQRHQGALQNEAKKDMKAVELGPDVIEIIPQHQVWPEVARCH
jgi:hypothetical protein